MMSVPVSFKLSNFSSPFSKFYSVGTSKRRIMSTTQLVDFLNKTQRDPRLNEILFPYANPARAKDIIQQYEPNKFNAQKGLLSFDGFLRWIAKFFSLCFLCIINCANKSIYGSGRKLFNEIKAILWTSTKRSRVLIKNPLNMHCIMNQVCVIGVGNWMCALYDKHMFQLRHFLPLM